MTQSDYEGHFSVIKGINLPLHSQSEDPIQEEIMFVFLNTQEFYGEDLKLTDDLTL